MVDEKLTSVGIGYSGRCRGWGSESEIREDPWGRVGTVQKLVGAGMPQGGLAAVEQRLCSGGAMGCGVLGLGAATCGWMGAGKPWGG